MARVSLTSVRTGCVELSPDCEEEGWPQSKPAPPVTSLGHFHHHILMSVQCSSLLSCHSGFQFDQFYQLTSLSALYSAVVSLHAHGLDLAWLTVLQTWAYLIQDQLLLLVHVVHANLLGNLLLHNLSNCPVMQTSYLLVTVQITCDSWTCQDLMRSNRILLLFNKTKFPMLQTPCLPVIDKIICDFWNRWLGRNKIVKNRVCQYFS